MAKLKLILRRARTLLWTAFSIVVVLLAVVVGIGRLLMPYSVHYQPELEQWLSGIFGQPVAVESFEGAWTTTGPRLTLRGLQLLRPGAEPADSEPEVVIESAALDLRPLGYLLAGQPLYNFRVIGADFDLYRDSRGEFVLSGFGLRAREAGEGSALGELARAGDVILQDSSLSYRDELLGIELGLADINGRLSLDDNRLATEIRARLLDRRSGLVYGEIDGTAVLRLDADERIDSAEWQLDMQELMLASLQGKLPANPFLPLTGWLDAQAWGAWSRGSGHRVNGLMDLRDALVVNPQQDLHLERVNTRFRWRYNGGGHWNLHLADLFYDQGDATWTSPRLSVARHTAEGVGLWISADKLPLEAPLNLTRDIMGLYDKPWPEGLPDSAGGRISELDLVLDTDWRLERLTGRISGARVAPWGDGPGVSGVDGEVDLARNDGQLRISGEEVRIDWPRMFREPLSVELPVCHADFSWGDGWRGGFEGCGVANADIAAHGDFRISSNTGKPAIDANFVVTRGDLGALAPYWPEAVMKPNVKAWLRRGLVGGSLRQGRVVIRGDMDDWPFRDSTGRFEAVAWLDGPQIVYLDDWPSVRGGEVLARFVGGGMEIRGAVEDMGGVAVQEVSVGIGDFKQARLEIEYTGASALPGLIGFLRQTPLNERVGVDLSEFVFDGPAAVDGRITVPLGSTPGELSVEGSVQLDGGRFSYPEHGIELDGIRGRLDYNERGFTGAGLSASTLDEAVLLELAADADSLEPFRAEIRGEFDVGDLLDVPGLRQDWPLLERLDGRSDWAIALSVQRGQANGRADVSLDVRSGLAGIGIDLPPPFDKPAEATWPLVLGYPLDGGDRPLDVALTGRALLRIGLPRADGTPGSTLLSLGGEPAPLPPPGLFRIRGATAVLDLDGWIDVVMEEIARDTGAGGLALDSSRFTTRELLFLDRLFPDVGLELALEGSELDMRFTSERVEGNLRYTRDEAGAGSLFADFDRLVLGDARSTGLEMDTDPKDLPALHLYARTFGYLGLDLGETRIEAYPTASGFHFEKVDAESDALSLQASGDWSLGDDGHRSEFQINMASESLGDFLQSMEISSSVQGGQTLVNLDAWWSGPPAAFALSRLNGLLDFSVIDGNITGADAGPGRLLGLVSFTALPKRLSLDFRDVFESGFAFDQASGSFALENGVARTDDVELQSSSATIRVSGETDLDGRRYDQVMTIRPGLGNTLPIIGALAAGPGGAAAGLALQGLLHEPLAEASQVSYTITGSWDEPIIEPVEVKRAGGNTIE